MTLLELISRRMDGRDRRRAFEMVEELQTELEGFRAVRVAEPGECAECPRRAYDLDLEEFCCSEPSVLPNSIRTRALNCPGDLLIRFPKEADDDE